MPNEVIDKPPIDDPSKEVFDDDTTLLDNLIADKDLKDLDEKEEKAEVREEKEEVEEPELEIDTNARAIDLTKVKEKYPDFAKTNEFRELRNAYHREAQYTEIFPTLDDAKEAAENNDTFNKLNDALVNQGDVSQLLTAVKEANPASYKKIASTFLDTIARTDGNLYTEIIGPVVRRMARQIYTDGAKILKRNAESDDGKALVATARNVMLHFFDDAEGIDKEEPKIDPAINEKEQELSRRERALQEEKYRGAYSVAESAVERNLDKAILDGLDPDGKLNEFTRDALVEKIKNDVKNQISNDQSHIRKMNSLWKRAEQNGFSRESLSSIVSAYLERARPIIPTVRNKFRNIAIKDRAPVDSEDKNIKLVNRGRSGRAPSNDGKINIRATDTKKIDYRHTTDDDIFEGKIKLKG